jgi:hypothetical protein
MTLKEKVGYFKEELDLIKNVDIRNFVIKVFDNVPDYGFKVSASSTGKYHPVDERGNLGTVIHSRRVVKWAVIFAEAFELTDPKDLDIVVASSILHDLGKRGFGKEPSRWTLREHGSIMVGPMTRAREETGLDWDLFTPIRECVKYHNGKWTEKEVRKPLEEFTRHELCVHVADMSASRMHRLIERGMIGE